MTSEVLNRENTIAIIDDKLFEKLSIEDINKRFNDFQKKIHDVLQIRGYSFEFSNLKNGCISKMCKIVEQNEQLKKELENTKADLNSAFANCDIISKNLDYDIISNERKLNNKIEASKIKITLLMEGMEKLKNDLQMKPSDRLLSRGTESTTRRKSLMEKDIENMIDKTNISFNRIVKIIEEDRFGQMNPACDGNLIIGNNLKATSIKASDATYNQTDGNCESQLIDLNYASKKIVTQAINNAFNNTVSKDINSKLQWIDERCDGFKNSKLVEENQKAVAQTYARNNEFYQNQVSLSKRGHNLKFNSKNGYIREEILQRTKLSTASKRNSDETDKFGHKK